MLFHLDIVLLHDSLGVFVEGSKPAGDEERNRRMGNGLDRLVDGVTQWCVLCPRSCKHLLEKDWSERGLQLTPIALDARVVFWAVGDVPHRGHVETGPVRLRQGGMVHSTVVKEHMQPLITNATTTAQALKEVDELRRIEAVLFKLVCQEAMTGTYRRAHCDAGLLPGSILDKDVGVRVRPCMHLETSGLEDTLVDEDEVLTFFHDAVDVFTQLEHLPLKLTDAECFPLWNSPDVDCFAPDTALPVQLAEREPVKPPIRKPAMEENAAPGEAVVGPRPQVIWVRQVKHFFREDVA